LLDDSDSDEIFTADGSNFGDTEFGLRYQFNWGIGWRFTVGKLRVKSDTVTDLFEISGKEGAVAQQLYGELATGSPVNLAIGVGATDEAPDTDVSIRMPLNVKN